MADTADLGSVASAYGFESHHPHHPPAEGFLPIDIRTFHLRFLRKGVTHFCASLRGALCSSRSMVDHLPSKQDVASSSLVYCSTLYAGVAQLAEQLICNQQVAGSTPFISSIRQGGRVA